MIRLPLCWRLLVGVQILIGFPRFLQIHLVLIAGIVAAVLNLILPYEVPISEMDEEAEQIDVESNLDEKKISH